jgi:sugar transferase EpsL
VSPDPIPLESFYRRHGKRWLDLGLVLVGLPLAALPMAAVAAGLWATLGRPILFRQRRPGLHGQPFTLLKFRTMRDATDEEGCPLPDEVRLTPVGRFLRRTSFDELPELWNVLRGDMSVVGPRPLLTEYLPKYTVEQSRRHAVRPGITGLAAVSGRQHLPFSRRLELDVEYVDTWCLALDWRILVKTIGNVILGRGVVLGQDVSEVDDIGLASADEGAARDHLRR